MHIHILGICGTFMGGLAVLAKEAGHRVTGCDANVYPPMSTQLEAQGIELIQGFGPEQIELKPDLYVIGNVVSRGNPLIEEIMNRNLPFTSGPQWMGEHILQDRWVLAVAGTHGKTTTSAMLAWILEEDRKSTRLNSSHTEIYTLSLHDALPISAVDGRAHPARPLGAGRGRHARQDDHVGHAGLDTGRRSEEHTSELQSHRDLHSFPTRRSSDLRSGWASTSCKTAGCWPWPARTARRPRRPCWPGYWK